MVLRSRRWSRVVGGGCARWQELQALTTWFPDGAPFASTIVLLSLTFCSTAMLASLLRRCSSNTKVLALVIKVRVEGLVEKVSTYESEKYFHSDPHGSQIGEIVSNQEFDSQTQILRRMQDETGSL